MLQRTDLGGGGLRSTVLALALRATVRPVITAWTLAPRLPWPYGVVDHAGRFLRPVRDTGYARYRLPHCSATRVTPPEGSATGRTVVYLHGGAFLVGGHHLHRQLLGRVAVRTGAEVLAPQYRKLPRHTVSDALADALDAYRHALDHGADPTRTVLMGDSAGGFLAVMLAVEIQRAGLPAPAGVVAMSPLVDMVAGDVPYPGCTLFPRSAIGRFQALAARVEGRAGRGTDPIDSPTHAPRRGLPPTLVQVSSAESLYADGVRLAEALADAGVAVELEVWDRQVHVFQAAAGLLPEAAAAIERVGDFVERVATGRARLRAVG
ncbi:alpha/beta hydrolase fold domain-containing protein [Nocardioides zeae]|uniref:Alpha/beta hydrolase fold domain-containing protein n=1 Tax=Nocardioides imazamoxiresistens TaxID=3231893 RepID=A0ABU3PUH1_9ACTN|nr:alpha/beta hydrolase fold domain-containing protein [Nocardioides zeae]MDT9592880.1 alpha/beta hydrolase fold domain-containing protein [Nocardioides zeae]